MKALNGRTLFVAILLALCCLPARAQDAAGDWIGELNGGFKVRIHIARENSAYTGYLTNPSGNQTVLDTVTSDASHLHFAVTKQNLSYDGVWNAQQLLWTGNLTFQQVYPLTLRRATAAELAPRVHKRPQEAAIAAGGLPYVQKGVFF